MAAINLREHLAVVCIVNYSKIETVRLV